MGDHVTVHTYSSLYPDDETEIRLRERWDDIEGRSGQGFQNGTR
jgi:hypothetical protein